MCHFIRDKLTEYWATTNQSHTHFYSSAMQRDRYCHILRFLHFTDNNNEPDMKDEISDGLWKTRNLFEILNKTFSKFYSLSEHLAVDEVIVLFKGRVIFQQYIHKKHKRFGNKIYKPCDETGYTYMTVYSFLDGGEGISHSDSRFIFVDDILQRWSTSVDTNSTQQRLVCLGPCVDAAKMPRVNCEWWEEKRSYWNVAEVWCVCNKMMFLTLPR